MSEIYFWSVVANKFIIFWGLLLAVSSIFLIVFVVERSDVYEEEDIKKTNKKIIIFSITTFLLILLTSITPNQKQVLTYYSLKAGDKFIADNKNDITKIIDMTLKKVENLLETKGEGK